ncbi:MAG: tetratricopeptide repeat protein, partial [Desulfatiglans sp.]|nr:tetratricopeptide repeat protein [Desulfatiglans sp.]
MTAASKEKMIGVIVCVLLFCFVSIANAQEKITDKTLMSLDSEVKGYLDKGDINNAGTKILDAYEKAAKDKGSLSPAATKNLSDTLLKMGEAVHKRDGADKAKAWLEKAIEMDNKNDEAHMLLGWTYFEKKDFDKSLSFFKAANAVNPSAKSYQLMAVTYFQSKAYQKALEACDAGIKRHPTAEVASAMLNIRAMSNLMLGNQDKAKNDYLTAINKDPDN